MKTCTIWLDPSSDRMNEQFSTGAICDECIASDELAGEDAQIVTISRFDPNFGNKCELCDKSWEQEMSEKI